MTFNIVEKRNKKIQTYIIQPSTWKHKKYVVILPNGKQVNFGDNRYEDYTQHKNYERRKAYLLRHSNEDWNDFSKAGAWAFFFLWNCKTKKENIEYLQKNYHIKVIFRKNAKK